MIIRKLRMVTGLGIAASLVVAILSAIVLPQSAAAHVLVRDSSGTYGAIFHMAPNDDPVAGEITSLHYTLNADVDFTNWDADILIEKPQYAPVEVPATITGTSFVGTYTFPSRGTYNLTLRFRAKEPNAMLYKIAYTVRVTRGVTGQVLQAPSPAWAKSGLILSAWGVTGLVLTVYARRKAIARHSRF